ncbi:hypothetical protein G7046_g2792 [Stylonectria norvegica]|nr:hypothetical protein G7046_g2792 [Stylonectria norvegica]
MAASLNAASPRHAPYAFGALTTLRGCSRPCLRKLSLTTTTTSPIRLLHSSHPRPFGPSAAMADADANVLPGRAKQSIAERVPAGTWDSHMHVVDVENYELSPNASYRPTSHTIGQAMAFEESVGIRKIVLVQPSIYGNDNSCLLDALKEMGPERGRGVVNFDPDTISSAQLSEWHELGVRGARLNIQSTGQIRSFQEVAELVHKYADIVRLLNWVLQVYVPMHLIDELEPVIRDLGVRFCIDHFGHPDLKTHRGSDPYQLPGFAALVRLLEGGHTFVKLSAPYRISQVADQSDIEPIARELIRVGGTSHVVFATDWPHTRFEGLDIRPWMETVLEWCGEDEFLRGRLFQGNAEDLWDVPKET